MKKKFAILALAVCLLLAVVAFFSDTEDSYIAVASLPAAEPAGQKTSLAAPRLFVPLLPLAEIPREAGAITLVAGNVTAELSITEGETLYETFIRARDENKISFDGKEYPGLGFFVTSIGAMQGKNGKNLIYYINGTEASVGISSYRPKNADIISWQLK